MSDLRETILKAEQGDANAQFDLGNRLYHGLGVGENRVEAVKWYRKAAEHGVLLTDVEAQHNLGVMYQFGRGVEKDYAEAVKWYQKAAEQGFAEAQFNLGGIYRNGEGVEKDNAEAMKWYSKAAEQGFADAQFNLGEMFMQRQCGNKDFVEAIKWFRKAADQGEINAQNNLGWAYENGYGVGRDYAEAVKWYHKAAESGHDGAQSRLEKMPVEALSRQMKFLKIGLVIFVIMAIFPPWKEVLDTQQIRWERGIGYAFIFETPRPSGYAPVMQQLVSVQLDFKRLAVGWIVDAVATAFAVFYAQKQTKELKQMIADKMKSGSSNVEFK